MTAEKKVPEHSITVQVNGQPFEIFMSFQLLNRICYLMADPNQLHTILQDPELREAILRELLTVRSQTGKVQSVRELDTLDISFDDIQNMLEWTTEHVADFTIAAVERANKVLKQRKERIDGLTKSSSTATPNGPEASASKSPAA